MNKLESLTFAKLNDFSLQKVLGGLTGPGDDWDTGCGEVKDCCTGTNCTDSEPYEPLKKAPSTTSTTSKIYP